ncbi:hypothetical protein N431DRAFT_329033 [Stipitochalara longipes BDJ]|nr:hypothetical protein N431DRAFT_329033 [Stipitochalara longipes BDJ]
MSLGFSLKDFLTVTKLISTISGSLKSSGGSSSDYQELVRELALLQRALTDIEHLTGPPSELPSINAIKCAALNCQYVLDEFAGKLQKYEKSLSNGTGDWEKVNEGVKKMEWEVFMKEDVRDLRAYLTSHVGSLNMRMITQGLSTASIAAKKADDHRTKLERKLEEWREGIKSDFKAQELIMKKTNTLLDKVIDLVNDTSNIQILEIVKSLQTRIPDPDIRFTWFQDPCRLEDARGHRLPIPSEFGYELVRAIIKELFKTGPGHRFVRAGDYQLSNIKNSNHLIMGSEGSSLIPGMNIRMAIVLNKLHTGYGKVCPMPHCGSASFVPAPGGGNTWLLVTPPKLRLFFANVVIARIAESGLLKPAGSRNCRRFKKFPTQVTTSRKESKPESRRSLTQPPLQRKRKNVLSCLQLKTSVSRSYWSIQPRVMTNPLLVQPSKVKKGA